MEKARGEDTLCEINGKILSRRALRFQTTWTSEKLATFMNPHEGDWRPTGVL